MKKIALLLVTITPFFTVFSAEKISFRDGTFLEADIYVEKDFEPNGDGVILTVMDRLYFHHYPPTEGSLANPSFYYHGPNPYGVSSCTPSRISFFHFETFALSGIREKISRMKNIPAKKKAEAIKGIDKAMSGNPPKEMTDSRWITKYYSKKWQSDVLIETCHDHSKGRIFYGQDYKFLKSFKKNDSVNNGRTLAIKRR